MGWSKKYAQNFSKIIKFTVEIGMLPKEDFFRVVELSPITSIDIIIRAPHIIDHADHYLLGLRKNEPAKGKYFVPGGAILKNESLRNAFRRITKQELGREINIDDAQFFGVYEHFYDSNFLEKPGIGTHYIVLTYFCQLSYAGISADEQHEEFRWMSRDEILSSSQVHPYTAAYFTNESCR